MLKCLMRGLRLRFERSSSTPLFRRRVSVEEQRAQKQNRFLRGRQIAYMIFDHYQANGAHEAVQGLSDLFNIFLQNDDVQEFDKRWDQILIGTSALPHENVLEGFNKMKLQGSNTRQRPP